MIEIYNILIYDIASSRLETLDAATRMPDRSKVAGCDLRRVGVEVETLGYQPSVYVRISTMPR